MRAFELHRDGSRRSIDPRGGLDAARSGLPVLLEGALTEFGLLPGGVDVFLDEVSRLTSRDRVEQLRTRGLERLHDVLDPTGVVDLLGRLHRRMAKLSVPIARA